MKSGHHDSCKTGIGVRPTGPRYRIVRIEPASNDVTRAQDCAPALAQLSEYRRRRPIPTRQEYTELAARHGFQLAPFGANQHGYDLIAYCYTSPRKDGVGRAGDQLRRIRARRTLDTDEWVDVLRCKVTDNPCGTDTVPRDAPCRCESCIEWRQVK